MHTDDRCSVAVEESPAIERRRLVCDGCPLLAHTWSDASGGPRTLKLSTQPNVSHHSLTNQQTVADSRYLRASINVDIK